MKFSLVIGYIDLNIYIVQDKISQPQQNANKEMFTFFFPFFDLTYMNYEIRVLNTIDMSPFSLNEFYLDKFKMLQTETTSLLRIKYINLP